MGRINKSRRAGSAPFHPMDLDRGPDSGATTGLSTDQLLRDGPRRLLMAGGMYVVGAVICFAAGFVLEAIAVSVLAVATVVAAAYLTRSHRRLSRY